MQEVWSTVHERKLTAGLSPGNGDERRTRKSQSCERAMLTKV